MITYTFSKDIITTTDLLKAIVFPLRDRIQISAAPIHTHIKISVAFENDVFIRNLTNLTVAKSKCMWNTCKKNETMKIICPFGIYKTMYHNGKNENGKVLSFI